MRYLVEKIETLFERFGYKETLTKKENISLLSKRFLIAELENLEYKSDFTIVRDQNGKPYFKSNTNCFFNISHTKNHVAVCFDSLPIGIDIEEVREKKMPVAQRFFHPKEVEYLQTISEKDIDFAFTQLWTIKEAYVKMTGKGIANNFRNINLAPKSFTLNQKYSKNEAQIESIFLEKEGVFLSICKQREKKK
ncbi:MAG: 4'-phosphopantetheinyl transferase superfamily protein [Bacteroidota bacterium]|nr:4'-phosphopantetheinyl transferase superfamily protein [Bacteroidota bacterium]